jgi:hypothetical protein
MRFLDEQGVIVGLRAKGRAKKDTSGFVQIADLDGESRSHLGCTGGLISQSGITLWSPVERLNLIRSDKHGRFQLCIHF